MDDRFQELPSWEGTQFSWHIAWGWMDHMGEKIPIIFQTPFLKRGPLDTTCYPLEHYTLHDDGLIATCMLRRRIVEDWIDEIESPHLEEIII